MAVNFFDNYNIQTDKPIDVRTTVATKADLYDSASYTDGLYAYKGMVVTVLNDETGGDQPQTYILTSDKSGYTGSGNWRRFTVGSSSLEDLEDIAILNPSPGDVLIYNSITENWENKGPIVESITEYSGTNAAGFTVLKTDGTSEFIVINELDNSVAFATQTTAGTVELSNIDDIRNANDIGVSGAIKVASPSAVREFVIENRDLVTPAPATPTDSGDVGTWSYDERYVYFCLPNGTSGSSLWRRTRIDIW